MDTNENFYTNRVGWQVVEIKGQKTHYINGYISTGDADLTNDIVTENGLQTMTDQINNGNIKLDVDHSEFKNEDGKLMSTPQNKIPIGKIISAKRDSKGIFIKAELNDAHPFFKTVWKSIKNEFIDAFSIGYKVVNSIKKIIDNKEMRLLDNIQLLNVALTGTPVNPNCRMTDVFTKSLKSITEGKMTATEEEIKPQEEAQPEAEAKPEEAPAEEAEAESVEAEAEVKEEAKPEEQEVEAKSEITELKSMIKSLAAEIKSMKDTPVFKSKQEEIPKPEMKALGALEIAARGGK